MKDSYCFWSIALGQEALLMPALIQSARATGVFKEFHVWTDERIPGAICHPCSEAEAVGSLFPLAVLQRQLKKVRAACFVWLDPRTLFVRHPGNVLRVLQGAPVHATLESDFCSSGVMRTDWEDCSLTNYARLARFNGVRSNAVFSVDSGFWIVQRDAIDAVCELAWDFWEFCERAEYSFSLDPVLAYTVQMLCGNPYRHTMAETADLWAVDRSGCFARELPRGQSWPWVDQFTGEAREVNPALVRLPHSRQALAARAALAALAKEVGRWGRGRERGERGAIALPGRGG